VALLDLDLFKAFNDEFGHQAGDRLLKQAAAAWSSELRATDLVARYGGEEFALALPGMGPDEAGEVLERLRRATPEGQSCSAGAVWWDGEESGAELIGRADDALYAAKRAGRDRSVFA
jgi:diguanylate cyclase (GGDEF)-like protein